MSKSNQSVHGFWIRTVIKKEYHMDFYHTFGTGEVVAFLSTAIQKEVVHNANTCKYPYSNKIETNS